MDWNVIAQYLPQYEKAAWLTLRLGVIGILWSIGIGLVCAVLQYDKVPVLRWIVGAYIQLSRNAASGTAVLHLLWSAESRHQDQRRDLRHRGSGISGRQLHGGGVPQRLGGH